jgi:hypothetical protein
VTSLRDEPLVTVGTLQHGGVGDLRLERCLTLPVKAPKRSGARYVALRYSSNHPNTQSTICLLTYLGASPNNVATDVHAPLD